MTQATSLPAAPSINRRLSPGAWLTGAVLLASTALALWVCEVRPAQLVSTEARRNMGDFIVGMFPPDLSSEFLAFIVRPALETIQVSVMGTLLAVIIGLPLALGATSTLTHQGILRAMPGNLPLAARVGRVLPYALSRGVLNLFRAVPELVWALMFVRAVGLGPFPGVLAIGIAYGGIIGKIFAEILEEVDPRPLEALQATGASRFHVLVYGLVPQALPSLVSYTLYRWECAIRAAAILGFVGAGGIGQQLDISMKMFDYHEVITLLAVVFCMVEGVDALSAVLRRRVA